MASNNENATQRQQLADANGMAEVPVRMATARDDKAPLSPFSKALKSFSEQTTDDLRNPNLSEEEVEKNATKRWEELKRSMANGRMSEMENSFMNTLDKSMDFGKALRDPKHPKHKEATEALQSFAGEMESKLAGNSVYQGMKAIREERKKELSDIPQDDKEKIQATIKKFREKEDKFFDEAKNDPTKVKEMEQMLDVMAGTKFGKMLAIPNTQQINEMVKKDFGSMLAQAGMKPIEQRFNASEAPGIPASPGTQSAGINRTPNGGINLF